MIAAAACMRSSVARLSMRVKKGLSFHFSVDPPALGH